MIVLFRVGDNVDCDWLVLKVVCWKWTLFHSNCDDRQLPLADFLVYTGFNFRIELFQDYNACLILFLIFFQDTISSEPHQHKQTQ